MRHGARALGDGEVSFCAHTVAQCRRAAELAGDPAAGMPVTLSIGIARVAPGEGGGDAIETATHALAQARDRGGDRVDVR